MLNKNLFFLLFSFVVVTSFATGKIEDEQKPGESKQEVDKKEVVSEVAKVKPEAVKEKVAEKKEAYKKQEENVVEKKEEKLAESKQEVTKKETAKESGELLEKAEKEWELVKDKQEKEPVKKEQAKEAAKESVNGSEIKKPEVFLIDKIDTVIYGPEETSIITKSDLDKMGLDGQKRTKDKLIFELQVYQDAKKYNIEDEKLVDKYIESIQAEQHLSLNDIKKMAYDFGYTYEEFRSELGKLSVTGQIMEYKVRSKVAIPEKEVRAYYDANPVYIEETYTLQRIFVPVNENTDLDDEKKNIESRLKSGEVIAGADYSENFSVEKPELADDKKFISSMLSGAYSEPVVMEGGFEVFKLIDRKERVLATFDQRYREIVEKLRDPLYDKLYEEYKNSLTKDSVVVELE